MTKLVSARRYLALWLPFLPADRWRAAQDDGGRAAAPIAFVAQQRGAIRIAALSPAAQALGLIPGMALADARAQLPDLATLPHDPAADRHWLERLAAACERYTPIVAIDAPDALVLDTTGAAHLVGGEGGLIADIVARWPAIALRTATAATPEAALALARYGPDKVDDGDEAAAVLRLPVAALRLDDPAETALRRAGLSTIASLAECPAAPLAARFGADMVAALDRLLGRADSRVVARRRAPALEVERRFAEPIVRVEAALAALTDLLRDAAVEMERRGQGGRRFAARLYRSDGVCADLAVETGRPVRDVDVVMRLFGERIAALADPLDPGFGFDLIRLAVPVLEPLDAIQLAIDGDPADDTALAALIDRLGARIGHGRIQRFAAYDSHIPERASTTQPAVGSPPATAWPAPVPGDPPLRPLYRFDPPQRIAVIAGVPDGPPRRFRWRGATHEVVRHEGPERIAGEWWRATRTAPTRDYYRIEDDHGRRFWIFRRGLYGEGDEPVWYVHGLFA